MSGSILHEMFNAVNPSLVRTVGANRALIIQAIYFAGQALGSDGTVEATQTEIAWRTGLTRTVVCRNLDRLEQDGLVESVGDPGGVKTYVVIVDAVEEACAPARVERARNRTGGCAKPHRGVCETAQGGVQNCTGTHSNRKKKSNKNGDAPSPPTGDDPPDPLTDPEYETYRNAARWVLARWAETNDRPPQKITVKAVEDMRLLMQRGPTNWATPAPITGDEIRTVTAAALRDPFWRQQIQSPGNLRKHWDRLTQLAVATKPSGPTPDQAVRVLVDTYNRIGHQGWKYMLEALDDQPVLRAVAESVGQRAFQGKLADLEFRIRAEMKAAA